MFKTSLILLGVLWVTGSFGQVVTLTSTTRSPVDITSSASYFLDTSARLSIEKVLNAGFSPVEHDNLRVPFSDAAVWYRCTLWNENALQNEWYLVWDNPTIERIDFYLPQPTGGFRIKRGGMLIPPNERNYSGQNPFFAFELPKEQEKTFYFRVKTQRGQSTRLSLYDADHFFSAQTSYNDGISFVSGLVTLRLFYVLFLALFAIRKFVFRTYCGMLDRLHPVSA